MTVQPTSLAAYPSPTKASSLRAIVIDIYRKHGPVCDFEMFNFYKEAAGGFGAGGGTSTHRTMIARRRELCQRPLPLTDLPAVGAMEGQVRKNPATGKDCIVWGLVGLHGAIPCKTELKISVRNGIKTASDFLTSTDDDEILTVVHTLLDKVRRKVRR